MFTTTSPASLVLWDGEGVADGGGAFLGDWGVGDLDAEFSALAVVLLIGRGVADDVGRTQLVNERDNSIFDIAGRIFFAEYISRPAGACGQSAKKFFCPIPFRRSAIGVECWLAVWTITYLLSWASSTARNFSSSIP
jgi:hypothetical protein